ncbi:MAG: S46 family peptidase [Gemmatimonadota bacterium]|nr:MAG: S46 family peptidase [Gemmatimonadota bacterium]
MNLFHSLALSVVLSSLIPVPSTAQVTMGTTPLPESTEDVPQAVDLDTIKAGRFDNGKMWTFEYPPTDYLRETYAIEADAPWFERARLGALRIPGCSASFVSPNGLVMTNHHCAREFVVQVTGDGEDLLDTGFYASDLEEERGVTEFEADQLIEVVDVTAEVDAALEGISDASARSDAREAIEEEIQERLAAERGGEEAGIEVEMIELWNGARTSAYVFRRYDNVKLVFAPELQIGFFGGDADNFTYPRYNLDFSFFRIYGDDGRPLETEHYFPWSEDGVEEGDAVFIVGNPGGTSRLQTVAELEFRRTVQDRTVLDFLDSRVEALEDFREASPEEAKDEDIANDIFGLENSLKASQGIWGGLFDPVLMARRADSERAFREALAADSSLQAKYGGLFDRMADVQRRKAEMADLFGAFAVFGNPDYTAATILRGIWAIQMLSAQAQGASGEVLAELRARFDSVPDQPEELQIQLMEARFEDMATNLGASNPSVSGILLGQTPERAARAIVEASALADSAAAAAAIDAGTVGITDPAVGLMRWFLPAFGEFQSRISPLGDEESELAARLGQARFAVYGTSIPPDATFSLRIADGVVKSYEYNGTTAPTHTTFFGLYDHFYSYGADSPWTLPERWENPPEGLDLATPMNFISTNDIVGGNSGSPVLNENLEIVGVVFDGNIESLPGEFIYVDTRNRSISVDARGILEALDDVYDADRIVMELTTGRLFETEDEADRARR